LTRNKGGVILAFGFWGNFFWESAKKVLTEG